MTNFAGIEQRFAGTEHLADNFAGLLLRICTVSIAALVSELGFGLEHCLRLLACLKRLPVLGLVVGIIDRPECL